MPLSGIGRVPIVPGREIRSEQLDAITRDVPLTRGLGRSYGDASLPAVPDTIVAGSSLADRILDFDPVTGVLRAEAGLSLDELYRALLPRGWFTPVTPGTRFVTLGGMVAADVHGKNHHRAGCFGQHVLSITLRVADGRIVTCSPAIEPDLFRATLGGMGLTGHILEVTVQLERVPTPWISQWTSAIPDVDAFVDALRDAAAAWPMTVGWIDCVSRGPSLGRGILFGGRWAEPGEAPAEFPALRRPVDVPVTPPASLVQPVVVRVMNAAYYRYHARLARVSHSHGATTRVVQPASFFYPLDAIGSWWRLYGPRGFIQCVLPYSAGNSGVREFLQVVSRRGRSSFLCVIKDCGEQGIGLLSFPKRGISIALDMPFEDHTQRLVDEMNELVIAAGGRIYLAKDALTRAAHVRAMDGDRIERFLEVRRVWDPRGRVRSALSVRLFGW
jgi:FAD/FMN-containing dehydrogenase